MEDPRKVEVKERIAEKEWKVVKFSVEKKLKKRM